MKIFSKPEMTCMQHSIMIFVGFVLFFSFFKVLYWNKVKIYGCYCLAFTDLPAQLSEDIICLSCIKCAIWYLSL